MFCVPIQIIKWTFDKYKNAAHVQPHPWSASSIIGCSDFDQYLELSSDALMMLSVFDGNNFRSKSLC